MCDSCGSFEVGEESGFHAPGGVPSLFQSTYGYYGCSGVVDKVGRQTCDERKATLSPAVNHRGCGEDSMAAGTPIAVQMISKDSVSG
jgi:hypothetical protein